MSAEPKYLYLTTIGRRSGRPRQIEIWFTRHRGRHYVIAEHGLQAQWVQNLLVRPSVQARVGPRSFRGQARVVDPRAEPRLVATIRRLSETKYGWGTGLVVEIASSVRGSARRSDQGSPGSARRVRSRPRRR